jgi:hypothetical protein
MNLLAAFAPGTHRVIESVSTVPNGWPLAWLIVFAILGIICFLVMMEEPGFFFGFALFAVLAWLIPFQIMTFSHKALHKTDVLYVSYQGHSYPVGAVYRIDHWEPIEPDIPGDQLPPR